MTKEDFLNWKADPVTRRLFNEMQRRIFEAREVLGSSAGNDPLQDRFLVGMIRAYTEILTVELDDEAEAE